MESTAQPGTADIEVSVVVPCFNEADNLEFVLRELAGILARLAPQRTEIVAVDDGSTDATLAELRRLRSAIPDLRIVRLGANTGQSAAFAVGFRQARGRVIVTMDADGQNDPADIPRLLEGLRDCQCCCGFRARRHDSLSKRLASRLANGIRNRVLGEDIRDTGCSLKAFEARWVVGLQPWDGMHRFIPSLLQAQGARIRQIPVNHRTRHAGHSHYTNWRRLKRTLADLRGVRWLKSRAVRPVIEVEE